MQLLSIFRFLLLASLVLGIAGAAIDEVIPLGEPAQSMSDQLLEASFGNGDPERAWQPWLMLAMMAIVFPLSVLGMVGMFVLQRWGRTLSLWTSVLSLSLYPLLGPMVVSGWASLLMYFSSAAWGAVLAMAYWSAVAERFAGRASNAAAVAATE